MIFYNATTKQGICQEIDRLCDSDDTSYPRLDKTARVNQGLEELVAAAISSDGLWEWDDTSQSDLPVGTGNLVEAQESYTFASEYLEIKRIKIKDVNGNWQPVEQIDQSDLDHVGVAIEEYFSATGLPTHYDILGDSLRLYPAPTSTAVTLTAGIKVEFVRTAILFTAVSTTTTDSTEPGLPSPFHVLLAFYGAIPHCMTYYKDRVALYQKKWDDGKRELIKFFAHRNKDLRPVMTMASIKSR
jgi:hypothetical protein